MRKYVQAFTSAALSTNPALDYHATAITSVNPVNVASLICLGARVSTVLSDEREAATPGITTEGVRARPVLIRWQ